MTTMRDALAELGWNKDLIDAFTAPPQYSLSAPTIDVAIASPVHDQATLVLDQQTATLSSGVTLLRV